MDFQKLKIAIILIEGKYEIQDRNTAEKMVSLIEKEFPNYTVSEQDILNFFGLSEDYQRASNAIKYDAYDENRFGGY